MGETQEIPKVSTRKALSDIKEMISSPIVIFEKYRKNYGNTFKMRFGAKTTIITADPDFLKHILKDKNSIYNKSQIQTKLLVEYQGVGLNNSHGEYWHKQRKFLSMGFTPNRLKETLPVQIEVLNEFLNAFDEKVSKGNVDIHKQMENFTVRSVGRSIFGSQLKAEDYEKFTDVIAEVQEYILKKIVKPYLKPWLKISGQDKKYQKIRQEGDKVIMDYIQERKKTLGKRSDILEMIMTTPINGTNEYLSDEKIKIELLQLMVAGNETSSTASTWFMYLLAKHPDCAEKIREEIEEVYGDGDIDYQKIHSLNYTSKVLDEALRVYPPFWMIDREAQEDDEYKGLKIKKGTTLVAYIYGAHQNKDYWENPEKFDPTRFDKEPSAKQHPFAHIPYGGGPRVCIGQNMAKMQMLLVVSAIVRKYKFTLEDKQNIGMNASMLIKPNAPIKMNFTKIR